MDSIDYNLADDEIAIEKRAKAICRDIPGDYTISDLLQRMDTNANFMLQYADEHERIQEDLEVIYDNTEQRQLEAQADSEVINKLLEMKKRRHEIFIETVARQIVAVILSLRYAEVYQENWSDMQQRVLNRIRVQLAPITEVITLE